MKKIILASLMAIALQTQAATIQDANNTYNMRGQDINNAMKAADLYATLADQAATKLEKAQMLTLQGLAIYFYAERIKSESQKENLHKKAFEIADIAIKLINKEGTRFGSTASDSSAATKSALAEAHYTSAINMGKWAEARGVLASLGQWGNMKKHLDAVFLNDETVASYGAYRTQGRAWLKLPFTHGGSKKKSLKDLKYAYDNTLNEDYGTSENSTTTLFYLDTLVARKVRGDQFCDVYFGMSDLQDLSDEEILEINPDFLPEFKTDIQKFIDADGFEEDIHGWADSNC